MEALQQVEIKDILLVITDTVRTEVAIPRIQVQTMATQTAIQITTVAIVQPTIIIRTVPHAIAITAETVGIPAEAAVEATLAEAEVAVEVFQEVADLAGDIDN